MNKKTILIILGIIVFIAVIAILVFLNRPALAPIDGLQTSQTKTNTGEATEISKFSSCVILEEEHCKKAERLMAFSEILNNVGIGFNLPLGTKIYAPFDAIVSPNVIFGGGFHPCTVYPTVETGPEYGTVFLIKWPLENREHRWDLQNIKIYPEVIGEITGESERIMEFEEVKGWPAEKMIKIQKGELIGEAGGQTYSCDGKKYNFWLTSENIALPPYTPNIKGEISMEKEINPRLDLDFVLRYFPSLK